MPDRRALSRRGKLPHVARSASQTGAPDSHTCPGNPWPGTQYECSDWDVIERFSEIVFNAGYASPVRTPRGRDILAACGQLKSETEKVRARARLMMQEDEADEAENSEAP
jgi:hypothetical protein